MTKKLLLYWGESKLYQQLSSSLDEICESIAGFVELKDNRSPRERDIDILKDHSDFDSCDAKNAVIEYFDPYSDKSNNLREVYCCLSGFDFSIYNKLHKKSEAEVEAYFQKKYIERIKSACELFAEKVKTNGIENLSFHFILLPFASVTEFRKLFFSKLGLTMEEVDGDSSDD